MGSYAGVGRDEGMESVRAHDIHGTD